MFTSPAGKACSASIWVRATSTTSGHITFNLFGAAGPIADAAFLDDLSIICIEPRRRVTP